MPETAKILVGDREAGRVVVEVRNLWLLFARTKDNRVEIKKIKGYHRAMEAEDESEAYRVAAEYLLKNPPLPEPDERQMQFEIDW